MPLRSRSGPGRVRLRARLVVVGWGVGFGHDQRGRVGADGVARDPFVALEAALQPLDDAVLGNRDDRRAARRQALADRLEVLVLEALVADLAPDAAAGAPDERPGDDARREDEADDAAGDRAAFAPRLAARVRGLLDLDLPVGRVHGHGRVDQLDRAFTVHGAEVLQGRVGTVFGLVGRDEHLERVAAHVASFRLVDLIDSDGILDRAPPPRPHRAQRAGCAAGAGCRPPRGRPHAVAPRSTVHDPCPSQLIVPSPSRPRQTVHMRHLRGRTPRGGVHAAVAVFAVRSPL